MKKLLATAFATTMIAAAAVAATSAPASAGGVYIGFGGGWGHHGGWHPHHGWGPGHGVVIEAPIYEDYGDTRWERHVDWCYDNYPNTYNENTNLYFFAPGKQRQCVSPFS